MSSFKRRFKRKDTSRTDLELHPPNTSPSTSTSPQELTVCVRDVHKSYGFGRNSSVILDGLNMTVPKGTIYALLGASGCGKTTLLSCILGCRKPNSGKIWTLGGSPGSKASGIPGPRVGYMPQETAVFINFTVDEIFSFYGWIAGMTSEEIKKRGGFLKELFMLPDTKQLVGNFSGGQQRRVSLASALLHQPELLILDEPTVGLDPLLRDSIWQHFLNVAGENTTIILTTHYIEEARQANIVGLMRGSRLLAEEPPQTLMIRYSGVTLEDVFLKLSTRQDENLCVTVDREEANDAMYCVNEAVVKNDKASISDEDYEASNNVEKEFELLPDKNLEVNVLLEIPPQNKYALVWKTLIWMMRNYFAMFCVILLPVFEVPCFCLSIGHDPVNLRVAVVNYETKNTTDCNKTLTCNSSQLSCSYFGYLEEKGLKLVYYDSENEAQESVQKAESYASIVVPHNYSAALRARLYDWYGTEPWDIESSQIDVVRDVSNKLIAMQIKTYFYNTFLSFIQDFAESCGLDRKVLKMPINIEKPIYGSKYSSYTDYIVPGLLVIFSFFLGTASMACLIIIDRRELNFEKAFVMGITETELVVAQVLSQLIPLGCQAALSVICAFLMFNMTQNGSYVVITVHLALIGFFGMCYGLLISCLSDREAVALLIATGSAVPMIFIGAIIWPVEAVHPLLQPVAYMHPLTQATTALRSILQKGWGFSSEVVYMSFVSIVAWTIIFLITAIVFLKYKRN